jgi:glycosyltransferase involved in cell wall biosynthesis
LPITIVGTENNKEFFSMNTDLLGYDKLQIVADNPTDENTRRLYQEHTIFLHPSMLEAGHPNLTLLEAASSCLPIVGTYRGSKKIEGLSIINDISTESVVEGILLTINDYETIRNKMLEVRHTYDWYFVCEKLEKFYSNAIKVNHKYDSEKTRGLYINVYN